MDKLKYRILNIFKKTSTVLVLLMVIGFSFGINTSQVLGYGDVTDPLGTGGGPNPPTTEKFLTLENPTTITSLQALIQAIIKIVLIISIPVIALFIIYSGFLFVSARGDPKKLETAKKTLLYTIIGAVVILAAWLIAQALVGTVQSVESGAKL